MPAGLERPCVTVGSFRVGGSVWIGLCAGSVGSTERGSQHGTCAQGEQVVMQTSWVLIDESKGAKCADGSTITAGALASIVEAVSAQLNNEFAAEYGGTVTLRVGASSTDIKPNEFAYFLVPDFPDEPGASAYHTDANGRPVSYCAVTTCANLLGQNGVSVDISHELCEAQGDPGCNRLLDDTQGQVHADEKCDAVEMQSYPYKCKNGTVVQLSNFLLQAWGIPGASGPFDYMTKTSLAGAVAPASPMATANGDGGNYQIVAPFQGSSETQVTAKRGFFSRLFGQEPPRAPGESRLVGTRRKGQPHWTSRAGRRLGLKPPKPKKAA